MASNPSSYASNGYGKSRTIMKVVGMILFMTTTFLLGLYVSTAIVQNHKAAFTVSVNNPGHSGLGPSDKYVAISLSENEEFEYPTTSLFPEGVENITNISGRTITDEVDALEGSHNGRNYVAYSFYVRNSGTMKGEITESMEVTVSNRGLKDAVRVRIYRNGISDTYASMAKDGNPEFGTIPFESDQIIVRNTMMYAVNQTSRYTIVIWVEGDDPECTDEIRGSDISFSLTFSTSPDSGSSEEEITE